jgi:hypothetical protein
MCKKLPVIWVHRVVDKKRIIGKMEGQGGGRHKGLLTPSPHTQKNKKNGQTYFPLVAK